PFSALDYQTKLQLEDLIAETLRERGKTAILVTHDLAEAIAVSDRIIVLGRNPGHIRRTFEIPDSIREVQPFYAREQPGFNELFHEIWGELEVSGAKE
ncbi:spermidine/putrescine ABC transporter ATP-binding protein, partial [Paenibacillus sp. 28ISP30-2]|nr:spermidine/putrescine ABC transporter ATP-binding protein [Paenibacillus sp. 28ISP30-2]